MKFTHQVVITVYVYVINLIDARDRGVQVARVGFRSRRSANPTRHGRTLGDAVGVKRIGSGHFTHDRTFQVARPNSVALSGHIVIQTIVPGLKPWANVQRSCRSARIPGLYPSTDRRMSRVGFRSRRGANPTEAPQLREVFWPIGNKTPSCEGRHQWTISR
jgi:hypothetical protein